MGYGNRGRKWNDVEIVGWTWIRGNHFGVGYVVM